MCRYLEVAAADARSVRPTTGNWHDAANKAPAPGGEAIDPLRQKSAALIIVTDWRVSLGSGPPPAQMRARGRVVAAAQWEQPFTNRRPP